MTSYWSNHNSYREENVFKQTFSIKCSMLCLLQKKAHICNEYNESHYNSSFYSCINHIDFLHEYSNGVVLSFLSIPFFIYLLFILFLFFSSSLSFFCPSIYMKIMTAAMVTVNLFREDRSTNGVVLSFFYLSLSISSLFYSYFFSSSLSFLYPSISMKMIDTDTLTGAMVTVGLFREDRSPKDKSVSFIKFWEEAQADQTIL